MNGKTRLIIWIGDWMIRRVDDHDLFFILEFHNIFWQRKSLHIRLGNFRYCGEDIPSELLTQTFSSLLYKQTLSRIYCLDLVGSRILAFKHP